MYIIRRRRSERLGEAAAHRGLPDVDRLQGAEGLLLPLDDLVPAELGEVSGPAHARRGRREQRERPEEIAEGRLGLRVDLADEERVRADLAADVDERTDDERRPPGPFAVPLLIERRVELAAAGRQQRAGAKLRGRMRVREDVEGRDAHESGAAPPG